MTVVESLLLTILILTCVYATYTDFKTGLIYNKSLLISGAAVIILDIIYYVFFQKELIGGFLLNVAVIALFSILLYAYSFWGAGDSKLMMLSSLAIPARFYASDMYNLPLITVIVQTFSIAFAYLIIESVILGIIKKNFFTISKHITAQSMKNILKSYFLSYVYILLFNFAFQILLKYNEEISPYIIPLLNFFVVFTVLNFNFFKKIYVIGFAAITDVVLMIILKKSMVSAMPPLWNLVLITVVLIFRCLAEKYNYKTISASKITKGMILSISTVMSFNLQKIKGLPQATTEDFRSKLTEEEAEAIRKWSGSQKSEQEIMIVRKFPFAIFITLGIVIFLVLRMWIS